MNADIQPSVCKRRFVEGIVAVCAIGVLLLITLVLLDWNSPPLTLAAPPALPERPTPIPTATPNKQPTVAPTPTFSPPSTARTGAYIALQVGTQNFAPDWDSPRFWTVVQWQDAFGDWHDVTGWQGHLELSPIPYTKIWWLPDYLFGAGPFRWQVTRGAGGVVLGTSEPFTLPQTAGKTLWVDVRW